MKLQAWRIVRVRHAATAFDGEGAWRYGGRWNSRGTRIVYTSATLSLAALEILVHLNPPVPFEYRAIPVEFDARLVQKVDPGALPAGWAEHPPSVASQQIGDAWAREGRSAVLEVPSVIVPGESNFLIHPTHPDFPRIRLGTAIPFALDRRLL